MPYRCSWAAAFAILALSSGVAAAQSPDQPKVVAARVFEELFNQGRFEAANDLYARDFVNHGATRDIDLKQDQDAARGWKSAVPDLHVNIEKLLVDGEFVTVLWRAEGTNTGTGNGLPATGKHINARGITIWRIVDGKIREEWSQFDEMRLMFQAGLLVPATATAK